MKKAIIAIVIVLCLAGAFFTSISAQPKSEGNEEIMAKLDKIIATQAEMMDYLKFIKNRSR